MPVQLSAEAMKLLLPRRSVPASAVEPTPASALRRARAIAKTYATARYGSSTHRAIYEVGTRATRGPHLAPVRLAAHELLSHTAWTEELAPIRAASIDVLAAADRMLTRMTRDLDLIPLVVQARGIEDAIRVVERRHDLQLAAEGGWTKSVFVVDDVGEPERYGPEPSTALREAVCALSDADYARARAYADAQRRTLPLLRRALVAYAFPDEPWGAEDLAAILAEPQPAKPNRQPRGTFLVSTTPTLALVRALGRPSAIATHAIDLACALPEADAIALFSETIPALLQKPKFGPLLKTPPREVALGLACFRTPAAAAALAPYAGSAILGPLVLAYFADAPELGGALEGAAKGKAKLEATAARALGKNTTRAVAKGTAKPGETPAILRERPWRVKPKLVTDVVAGLAILGPEALGLPPEHLTEAPEPAMTAEGYRPMTEPELVEWRRCVEETGYTHVDYTRLGRGSNVEAVVVPDHDSLWAWNEHTAHASDVRGIAARFGVRAIPGFARRHWTRWLDYEEGPVYLDVVVRFVSPRLAPSFAHAATRQKARRAMLAWFRANPGVGALGLIPDAVGEAGDARANAEAILLELANAGERATIERAAKAYGAEAAGVIRALLARDPLALGAKPPKPPPFLRRERLPPILTPTKRALDDDARDALLEILALGDRDAPYPGFRAIRDACDPESLGAFALELLEQWVIGDAPRRHEWMQDAVVHFPSDAGTRRLGALAREWSRKHQAKAIRACNALAALATDAALLHLGHVAETTRFDALRREASAALAGAAAVRGLDEDALADRTVGTVPALGEKGTLELSYGTRRFVVELDASLAPVVRAREGKTLGAPMKSLPRPTKADDAAAAKEARAIFDGLVTDLEQIASRQVRRFERSMVRGRAWSAADFLDRVARHPLLVHLARRLVWVALPKKGASCTFRVAEDGTFADVRDRSYALPESATVRLAHPAIDELGPWSQVVADYEVVQPFPQVGREVATLSAKERGAKALARTAGIVVRAKKILGVLESRGWRRSSAGHVASYAWSLRDRTLVARLPLTPGFEMAYLATAGDQTTGELVVERAGQAVRIDALDAVAVSEVLRDVEALRG